uniref:B-like cyclin n=1 Tax=Populus davidiana TaxID=266767 RepID=A0A6M2EA76_9ROSI
MSHSHSHLPDHSASALNSLYCGEDASEVVQQDADTWISSHPQFPPPPPSIILSPPSDEHTITKLIDSESHFMPLSDYLHRCRHRSIDITARQDSINWILKVYAHYEFRPLTALLSVNYFDRFLSSYSLPENGWPFQLLSVACLSLAAKMEEPDVPLLLDLQILEPGFIFEPKNIQKMELRVMANLNWRLRSITPFDYLDYFISKLPSCSSTNPDNFSRLLKDSSDLILNTTRVIDFLGFTPSTVAAAAAISAAGKSCDTIPWEAGDGQFFHERVNKEMVRSCHQLMEEYLIDTCPLSRHKVLSAEASVEPASPVGVLDAAAACGSCDTRSENPISASIQAPETEPIIKRLRSSASDVQEP